MCWNVSIIYVRLTSAFSRWYVIIGGLDSRARDQGRMVDADASVEYFDIVPPHSSALVQWSQEFDHLRKITDGK